MRPIVSLILIALVAVTSSAFAADLGRIETLSEVYRSGGDVAPLWNSLTAAERQDALEKARFDALHEKNGGLWSELQTLNALRAPGNLNTNNMLRIPLRKGVLELKALFKKMRGEITVCTPTRFEATLDTYRMVVIPHPTDPKKVLSSFSGNDPQVPQQPIGAVITSNGTTAKIFGEDGTTVEVTHTGNGTYKFVSNKLPVTVSARYID